MPHSASNSKNVKTEPSNLKPNEKITVEQAHEQKEQWKRLKRWQNEQKRKKEQE